MEVMSSASAALHFKQTEFNFNSRSSPATTTTEFPEFSERLSEDFGKKLKIKVEEEEEEEEEELEELLVDNDHEEGEEEEEEEDNDDDFSFACMNTDESQISADDIFQNGQIRPIFPIFGREIPDLVFAGETEAQKSLQPPLRKLFVEEWSPATADAATTSTAAESAGPFCQWSQKTVRDASPERCKKSNSTGFSKLRRFRELVLRSNSDGKDAFVFLHDINHATTTAAYTAATTANNNSDKKSENRNEKVKKAKKKKETTPLTTYMERKAKESDKRKPYLPYKQVGFFTNVNGLTRNIHPF